jgi:hypothetical protein
MTPRCPHCKKFIKASPQPETVYEIRYETKIVYVPEPVIEKVVAWACLTTIFLLISLIYIAGGGTH